MGRARAESPKHLAAKLKIVRLRLEWTQERMFAELKQTGAFLHPGYVSLYEAGERLPSLLVLLAYARIGGVPMETLVDDKLELPER